MTGATRGSEDERTYARSAYARSWLRNGGRAVTQLGWLLILLGAVAAFIAEPGDTPVYLAPAIIGMIAIAAGIILEAESER